MQMQMTGERQEFDAFERRAVQGILSRLSIRMMQVLMRHGEGPQEIRVECLDYQTTMALRGRGLVAFDTLKTRRTSSATSLGRKVLALMLAMEAETLMESEQV